MIVTRLGLESSTLSVGHAAQREALIDYFERTKRLERLLQQAQEAAEEDGPEAAEMYSFLARTLRDAHLEALNGMSDTYHGLLAFEEG